MADEASAARSSRFKGNQNRNRRQSYRGGPSRSDDVWEGSGSNQALLSEIAEMIDRRMPKNNQSSDQGPCRGFMASIKYRSSVACLSEQKSNIAYIDSGGTHHFLRSRSMFETYEKIDITDVDVASGISELVGN